MVMTQYIITALSLYFKIDNSPITRNDSRIEEIYSDGSVDIIGNVRMIRSASGDIPVEFNIVQGYFQAQHMNLNSLKNSPIQCTGLFVSNNNLENFNHLPSGLVNLDISNNKFKNFQGLKTEFLTRLDAFGNPLESLEGLPTSPPEEPLGISITWSKHLPLLRLLVATDIDLLGRPGEHFEPVESILRRYAGQGKRAMFDCQKELEDAGFEENARW